MIYAAILAGGIGSRMESGSLPKQFIEIEGKPLIIYTLEPFLRCSEIEHIVVAVTKGWLDYAEELLEACFPGEERLSVTVGGGDRLSSLSNACAALSARYTLTQEDILLTHDGARPFVVESIIRDNIALMAQYDAVTSAVPTIDTILCSEDGDRVCSIPPRQTMFSVQTPQTFRLLELVDTMASLSEDERATLTDGAKIYLLRGKSVGIAMGDAANLKITEPKDLDFAEIMIKRKKDE